MLEGGSGGGLGTTLLRKEIILVFSYIMLRKLSRRANKTLATLQGFVHRTLCDPAWRGKEAIWPIGGMSMCAFADAHVANAVGDRGTPPV